MDQKSAKVLVLDGAMGTELLSRGHSLPLPLWSADCNLKASEDVLAIHQAYIESGADILSTNTFRTTPRTYFSAGYSFQQSRTRARESLLRAVELARKAAGEKRVWGSITSLEDCYRPDLSPGKSVAEEEFAELIFWFRETAVDGILFETLGHAGEIQAAVESDSGPLPKYLSLILKDEDHLLDGTELADWLPEFPKNFVNSLLLNCSNYKDTLKALEKIAVWRQEPIGAYPNLGLTQPDTTGHIEKRLSDRTWESFIHDALLQGVTILGGCCGSTPEYIHTVRKLVDHWFN
ncbi:MAG: homocysteine S-methyltransferase family protein [FCB group bacterium]|nr:homocysteine S-methyltransferase family protein [FCB group bacterium]